MTTAQYNVPCRPRDILLIETNIPIFIPLLLPPKYNYATAKKITISSSLLQCLAAIFATLTIVGSVGDRSLQRRSEGRGSPHFLWRRRRGRHSGWFFTLLRRRQNVEQRHCHAARWQHFRSFAPSDLQGAPTVFLHDGAKQWLGSKSWQMRPHPVARTLVRSPGCAPSQIPPHRELF